MHGRYGEMSRRSSRSERRRTTDSDLNPLPPPDREHSDTRRLSRRSGRRSASHRRRAAKADKSLPPSQTQALKTRRRTNQSARRCGLRPRYRGVRRTGPRGHAGSDGAFRQPRRAASMVATSIFFIGIIASKARFASPPPAASASVSVRGVICQERPHRSLHQPH
jgi:hypothetical protein